MSEYFIPDKPIPFGRLKGGFGEVKEEVRPRSVDKNYRMHGDEGILAAPVRAGTWSKQIFLVKGGHRIEAYQTQDGGTWFARYSGVESDDVIEELERKFGVKLVSEHDDRFWGLAAKYGLSTWEDFLKTRVPDGSKIEYRPRQGHGIGKVTGFWTDQQGRRRPRTFGHFRRHHQGWADA